MCIPFVMLWGQLDESTCMSRCLTGKANQALTTTLGRGFLNVNKLFFKDVHPMFKSLAFCGCLLLSSWSVAENLNKCIDPKDGRAVFTTQACETFGLKTSGAFIFTPYESIAKQSAGMNKQAIASSASAPSVAVMTSGNSGHCAALETKQKKLAGGTTESARKQYAEAVAQFKAKCR